MIRFKEEELMFLRYILIRSLIKGSFATMKDVRDTVLLHDKLDDYLCDTAEEKI